MHRDPSVILVREWEGQTTSSGCCGRLEGDFLTRDEEPVFAERRATMCAMGPLYRAIRDRFGEAVRLDVVDPRNALSLAGLMIRDFWTFRVGLAEAVRTLATLPVQGVIVNGRLVARGEWPDPETVLSMLDEAVGETAVPPS